MPFGTIHIVLRKIADIALHEFFKEIHVIGEENLPTDGPLIVCCTHHNMMIDPGVLANTTRDKRPLHYWAKASLFKHPMARKVLLASGVIPVDRGSKDNQKLFAGTFEALADGEAVALFPEGTSYTLPRIVQVKDGASWSALEYVKWVAEGAGGRKVTNAKDLVVVPAGITYTDKSKYRSCAVIEYGAPIRIADFEAQFLSPKEGESRAAVKALTHAIEDGMVKLTINAPTWEVLLSSRMARDLIFGSWRNVPLADFKNVGQTLVDLFSTPWDGPEFASLMGALTTYHSLLKSSRLSNDALQTLPLPRVKKSSSSSGPAPIPSRLSTILPLLQETLAVAIRLPFFIVPLLIHIPVFWTTRWIGQRSEREEESVAQNKVVVGIFFICVLYSFWFCAIWALFWLSPIGAIVAAITVYAMAVYFHSLIDDSYVRAKRLYSAYRVLVGVWGPKRWDLSLTALTQYTTTQPPPPNEFLKIPETVAATFNRSLSSPTAPTMSTLPAANSTVVVTADKKDGKKKKPKPLRRPPTRRLIRHVLRARTEAARQLGAFLKRIDRDGVQVSASAHLVDVFGGGYDSPFPQGNVDNEGFPTGWRSGKEVMSYLRSKGARFDRLYSHLDEDQPEYEWAALQGGGGELSPLYTPGFPMSPGSPGSGSGYGSTSVSGNVSGNDSKGEELDWVVPNSRVQTK